MKYYVIGAGAIGKRHHQNLTTLDADVTLLGWRGFDIADFTKQLAKTSQETALVIATASQIRLPLITIAAAADIPIYVEKPIAYRVDALNRVYDTAQPILDRSMVGFMMRYHPVVMELAKRNVSDSYAFSFEIGHDVREWRENWHFKDSYAANSDGGGVLLDLCHELDMAHLLFPEAKLQRVDCLGHSEFDGIDVATRITLAQTNGPSGTVAMDYLSPHSLRRINLRAFDSINDINLLTCTETRATAQGVRTERGSLERNTMFLDIMRDFMILAETGQRPENPIAPVMDRVYDSCKLIAQAWEARTFHGVTDGGMT